MVFLFAITSEPRQVRISLSFLVIMITPTDRLIRPHRALRAMLDEQSLNYGGIYAGKTSDAPAREEVESSDLCLLFGRMDGDIK
jgi:TPP-dependent 2-oxoacid decarboxylase